LTPCAGRAKPNLIDAAENLPAHLTRNPPTTSTCGSESDPPSPDDRPATSPDDGGRVVLKDGILLSPWAGRSQMSS
jgi:hypothetical protein